MSSMWQPYGRRSSIQIIAEMLKLSQLSDVGKTEIMNTVNLSHTQTQKYLSWLVQIDVLQKVSGNNSHVNFKITGKGVKLLSYLENLEKMLHNQKPDGNRRSPDLNPEKSVDNFQTTSKFSLSL